MYYLLCDDEQRSLAGSNAGDGEDNDDDDLGTGMEVMILSITN